MEQLSDKGEWRPVFLCLLVAWLFNVLPVFSDEAAPIAVPGPSGKTAKANRPGIGLSVTFRALDIIYVVNETILVPTIVQSCRIEPDRAALLARQAKRRYLEVSTLSSLYLTEKALEEEYPGLCW
jgi:hypothetical protein